MTRLYVIEKVTGDKAEIIHSTTNETIKDQFLSMYPPGEIEVTEYERGTVDNTDHESES